MYLTKCLYNLKTIASIAPGQRICTRDEYISQEQSSTIPTAVYRTRADGRDKMLTRVTDIVHATCEIADRILESKYLDANAQSDLSTIAFRNQRVAELKLIWERLGDAKRGIDGQRQTYPGDASVGHPIEELLHYIDESRTRIRIRLQACNENVY